MAGAGETVRELGTDLQLKKSIWLGGGRGGSIGWDIRISKVTQ